MDGTLLLAGGAAALASLGFLESWQHRNNLRHIPIRIHVNGTRGKSSVTRLIAAGMRAGGIRTCAKTTGTLARMIMPDAQEFPIFRPARANIIEQKRVVKAAVANGAEALVIECMAVQPVLQSLCELKLVQATHGVITNARADHLDVMGPTVRDVAKALCGTMPIKGRMYTTEQRCLDVFNRAAKDRKTKLVPVGDEEIANVTWDEVQQFRYIEHPENIALALRVCCELGIDRQVALQGMWQATPDPGAMNLYEVDELQQKIIFVNGFAANDPESTGHNWNMVVDRFHGVDRRIAVVNCRADRTDRSVQLADACLRWKPADHYMVIGSATDAFARRAITKGMDRKRLTCAERMPAGALYEKLGHVSGRSALAMGMGNISGPGLELLDFFRQRDVPRQATTLKVQEAA
mgnify:FL=1